MAKAGHRRKFAYRASRSPVSSRRVTDYRLPPAEDVDASREWFLIYTNPKCERRAQLGLMRAGYQTYLPTMRRVIERPGYPARETIVPMFPRYLFVSGRQRTMIRTIDGVQDVVRNGLDWAQVPSPAITAMISFQNEVVIEPPKHWKGQTVMVGDGPFSGFQVIIAKMLDHDCAQVLVSIFGRQTPVTLHVAQMEAA